MKKIAFSTKKLQLDKTNTTIVLVISVAMFLSVFSLFACRALLAKRAYQAKIIGKQEVALKQLQDNLASMEKLTASYVAFAAQPTNVIGGSLKGTGLNDGDNAKIILDALPSKYDFPAITTSFDAIFRSLNLTSTSITGTDDEINQEGDKSSAKPEPVEIPLQFSATGSSANVVNLMGVLERSIKPYAFTQMTLTAADGGNMTLAGSLKTFYLPAQNFTITKEKVQ